jgi:leucyl aminopeptidase
MNTPLDCFTDATAEAVPVRLLTPATFETWRREAPPRDAAWAEATGFDARPGTQCLLPDGDGRLAAVLASGDPQQDPFVLGELAQRLPPGDYRLAEALDDATASDALLGFALGAYRFTRYREGEARTVRFALPAGAAGERARAAAQATYLARDLINTPAEDMMPRDLADAAVALGTRFGAETRVTEGDALLREGFPAIHAVGRASGHAPCLVHLDWGRSDAPRIALVGKGVCFDSGGLDLKPARGMRLMKKDMGGAACTLALAQLIMDSGLDLRLQVLVPAVENAVSGNAMRPGDVVRTRKGLTVEIDNTDAEGRVILADALALAAEGDPELVVDYATLTGAARVAVGTEIAAMFSNDDAVAAGIAESARSSADPVWRMPLHRPYGKLFESQVADFANSGASGYAGAITAALFLERFVPEHCPWAHFDIMAWNDRARPGRPEGGEAMGVRAVFGYLRERFAG